MLVLRLGFTLHAWRSRLTILSPRWLRPPAITESIRLDPPGAESRTAPVSPDGGRLLCRLQRSRRAFSGAGRLGLPEVQGGLVGRVGLGEPEKLGQPGHGQHAPEVRRRV